MLIVRLKPGKEAPVLRGHPWIFSGAVDKVQGEPHVHKFCRVLDAKGRFVCQGMYNPLSQIAVRVLTFGKERLDRDFFEARIKRAVELRRSVLPADVSCHRVVNAEGDGLPGLVVDRYGGCLVVQISTPGMEEVKAHVVDALASLFPDALMVERSDTKARSVEGLRPEVGPLKGGGLGGDVVVSENGLSYAVDVLTGDRTGFYLEHRLTRSRIAAYAKGRRVLDLFSYSGSFSVCALAAGAVSVASVDSSAPAQALLRKNMELNRIRPFVWRHHRDDAVSFLEADRDSYDLVLVDAPASVSEYREYRRVLDRAVARLGSPGILFVAAGFNAQFSGPDLLKAVHKSASGLSRNVRVLETLSGPADFPWLPSHPEGLFQGGFVLYLD